MENQNKPWTKEDDDNLLRHVDAGKSNKELSELFQRSEGAISSRKKHLGLLPESSVVKFEVSKYTKMYNPQSINKSVSPKSKDLFNHPKHGRVRKHYKTGLEISEDGVFVQKSYSDSHTGDTKYFSPEIHRETDGREYVNWSDRKVYIDEMVCTCFHGSSKEGQSVVHIDGRVTNSKASNLKWS